MKNRRNAVLVAFIISSVMLTAGGTVFAEGEDAAIKSLAEKAQNPIADMISLPFQNNFNFGYGPDNEFQNILNIQPVYPIELGGDWTLITRNILPIAFQSWPENACGLGDLVSSFFFVPPSKNGLMVGVGPVFGFPTATHRTLGSEKWSAGPTGVVVYTKGPWVVGGLINNLWSYAGHYGRADVNFMTAQPFINYNLKKGWYLTSAPIVTASWEEDNDNRWTVPIGGGIGKLFRVGKQPINMNFTGYYNVERPNNAPDWLVRLMVVFLFPKS